MNRGIVVALGDTHGGFRYGLMNPRTVLPESGQVQLIEAQEYLWEAYLEDIEAVKKLADKDPIMVIHNGDVTQGQKYPNGWVSTRMSDQLFIAKDNLMPWLDIKNVMGLRLATGTGSHVFGEGSAEYIIGQNLQELYPKKDIKTVIHGLMNVFGVDIDYAHHGPYTGSRNWLKGNVALYYLRSLLMDEIMVGNEPPDLVLRAHYHEYVKASICIHANGKDYEAILIITPSYCMLSDYAVQATRSTPRVTNGLVAIEIVDGAILRTHRFTRTLDVRTREIL